MKLNLSRIVSAVIAVGILGSSAISTTANAQLFGSLFSKEHKSAIEKFKDTGEVFYGYRGSSMPLSYVGSDGKPVGFAVDLTIQAIHPELEKAAGRKLKIRFQEITPQTRIPLIETGKVDLECSSTTNTAARRKQVNFSYDFYLAGLAIMSDKTVHPNGLRNYADLINKEVVVVSGTTAQTFLESKNAFEGYDIKLIRVKDNAEAMLYLEQGRSSLFVQDDILMAGVLSKSKDKSKFTISKYSGQNDSYGCMSKLGDKQLADIVNAAMVKWAKSGKMEASYNQWFTKPLPETGLNINWPMSPATQNAINELKAK